MEIRVYFSAILSFMMLAGTLFPFFLLAQNSECPVCAQCYTPITKGKYYRLNNKTYCSERCMKKVFPKCYFCGAACLKYWTSTLDPGKKLCENCKDLPNCFFCGKISKHSTVNYGRKFCRECSESAVGDPETAEFLFRKVRREFKNTLGISTTHRITFSIVTPSIMEKKKRAKLDPNQTGLFVYQSKGESIVKYNKRTGRVLSRNHNIRKYYAIYILTYLPLTEFRRTVVHELTHDWMEENYPHVKNKKINEGVCEYMSWLFLKTKDRNTPNANFFAMRIEKNPDPVYGNGFRMIRDIAGKGSWQTRIQRIKNYLKNLK